MRITAWGHLKCPTPFPTNCTCSKRHYCLLQKLHVAGLVSSTINRRPRFLRNDFSTVAFSHFLQHLYGHIREHTRTPSDNTHTHTHTHTLVVSKPKKQPQTGYSVLANQIKGCMLSYYSNMFLSILNMSKPRVISRPKLNESGLLFMSI